MNATQLQQYGYRAPQPEPGWNAPAPISRVLYKPEYAQQAAVMCKLGATDFDLAEAFNVHLQTIQNWKNQISEFNAAVRVNKEMADERVEMALYHRAVGYSHNAVKFFNYEGEIIPQEFVEHIPPEVTAIRFWLQNRKPKEWRQANGSENEPPQIPAPQPGDVHLHQHVHLADQKRAELKQELERRGLPSIIFAE